MIAQGEIQRIVADTFVAFLGLEVGPGDNQAFQTGSLVTGVVQITGAWQGSVMLDCSADLAHQSADLMFGVDPGSSSPEEVRDAVGELVNMIAGNIKALLPEPTQLSLPTVVEGRDYQLTIPGSSMVNFATFLTDGKPLQVKVLHREEANSSGPTSRR